MLKLNGLEYSLTIGCRYNCCVCPQQKLLSAYFAVDKNRLSVLSFKAFKESLTQVNDNGFISFAGMSEPFLNPDCAKMIRYAYDKGYKVMLYSTFELMTDEDWALIKDINFETITVHVADEDGNAKFKLSADYPGIVGKILKRFPQSLISCHGNYHPVIAEIVGERQNVSSVLIDRAGNLGSGSVGTDKLKFNTFGYRNGKILCGALGGYNYPLAYNAA